MQTSFCLAASDVVMFSLLPFLFQTLSKALSVPQTPRVLTDFSWAPVFYRSLVISKRKCNWDLLWFQTGYRC